MNGLLSSIRGKAPLTSQIRTIGLSIFISSFGLLLPSFCIAQTLSIAVPQLALQTGIQNSSESVYSSVIRSVSSPTFLSLSEAAYEAFGAKELSVQDISDFRFVDSLSFSEFVSVSFREGVRFSNGRELSVADVEFSLKNCGLDSFDIEFSSGITRKDGKIEVKFRGSKSDVIAFLGGCVALEAQSGEVFHSLLGTSNFFVGLGVYEISFLKPGVRVGLRRVKDSSQGKQFRKRLVGIADEVEIREIPDARRALTALRYGSIDLFFTRDQQIAGLAQSDETLGVRSCRGHQIIHRRGLELDCDDDEWISRLRYIS